jgi:hypothetical protein
MKIRITAILSKDTFERLDSSTGNYKNSSTVESIMREYIELGDYSILPKIKRSNTIPVCFTIEPQVIKDFKRVNPICKVSRHHPEIFPPNMSQSLEVLIRKWLENKID